MKQQEFELVKNGFRYYSRVLECEKESCQPILFLGGAFQSMDSWDKFISHFQGKTTLILADLPGVGKADLLTAEFGLDFLTECVKNIIDHTSVQKINILSASYGSPIGYLFAKKYPYHVDHLILAGIMKEIPRESYDAVYRTTVLLRQKEMKDFADEVINGLLCLDPLKVSKSRIIARMFRKQLMHLSSEQSERYIENTLRLFLHTPININQSPNITTLVFTGEHDPFTKPEYCKEIAKSFNNSIFTTIKNADHLFHMEQFDTVIDLTHKFFFNETLENINGCNRIEYLNNNHL